MPVNGASEPLDLWLAASAAKGHRALLVFAGERGAALSRAAELLDRAGYENSLTLSNDPAAPSPRLPAARPSRVVGMELDALVFDACTGFDPDLFGAASGTVRGGGLVILCTPPLAEWAGGARANQRYLARIASLLGADSGVRVVDPHALAVPAGRWELATLERTRQLTADQQRAVEAVCHVVHGQRRRPVLLLADRGRGKSTTLGHAAARLAGEGRRIAVTAVGPGAVEILFRHAREAFGRGDEDRRRGLRIVAGQSVIEYIDPARLLASEESFDLVIVDEAAALPLHRLERLLERFARLAFASTVHGYEGSGRGFATRFRTLLDRRSRGWRTVNLDEPVRWAPGDPVERIVADMLLLDAEAADIAQPTTSALPEGDVEFLDRERLAGDETMLRQFFGLLVDAHYRTRPSDLRFLLDDPALELVRVRARGAVIAAAVVAVEEPLAAALATRVRGGRARPRGQVLAETLAAQLGEGGWLELRGMRVVRIAVHPHLRRRGIGARIVGALVESAGARGMDYLGSSFAAGEDMLDFWAACGFAPAGLGARRNVASGVRSVLAARALTPSASETLTRARGRFSERFPLQLAGLYADEEPPLVARICVGLRAPAPRQTDVEEALAFAEGRAGFEAAFAGLWHCARFVLSRQDCASVLSDQERGLLIELVLQQRPPRRIGARSGSAGRRDVLESLARVYRRVLPALAATHTRRSGGTAETPRMIHS